MARTAPTSRLTSELEGAARLFPRSACHRRPNVVLAEDDDEFRSLVAWTLRNRGCDVTECRDGMELLDRLVWFNLPDDVEGFSLVITDVRMPGFSGLDVLSKLRALPSPPPTVVITAFGDRRLHRQARRLGAAAVLDKPFPLEALASEVERLLFRPSEHEVSRGMTMVSRSAERCEED